MKLRNKVIPVYRDTQVLKDREERFERDGFDALDYFEGYCRYCGCTVFLPYADIHRIKCDI